MAVMISISVVANFLYVLYNPFSRQIDKDILLLEVQKNEEC